LDEKISNLTNEYNTEKKERESLEQRVEQQNNEVGLSLCSLRRKLQSYVWEDMNAWNVLLEIKTDISPEDFHEHKLREILDLTFLDQVKDLDSELEKENQRLVDLQVEREKESARPEEVEVEEEPKVKRT